MKPVLILLLFLTFSAHAQTTKPVLISGFDDVLRQAENTGLTKSAVKILEKDKTFAGMPELYQVITSDETTPVKFTLVSGIATWFEGRIRGFLKDSQYPTAELALRNWITEWSIEKFKVKHLEKTLTAHPGRHFIVIFDNSEPSLEIAETIRTDYGDKISPVYLHEVIFRSERPGTVNYITALDIALNEYQYGRLTAADVEKVAQAVLDEKETELIIPEYAYCPTQYDPCSKAPRELAATCTQVQNKIIELCKNRKNN
jgi:phosphatidate phosphatase APP1